MVVIVEFLSDMSNANLKFCRRANQKDEMLELRCALGSELTITDCSQLDSFFKSDDVLCWEKMEQLEWFCSASKKYLRIKIFARSIVVQQLKTTSRSKLRKLYCAMQDSGLESVRLFGILIKQ